MANGSKANEPVSIADYARHRGCASSSVLKAIRSDRLNQSVVYVDGKPKIIDVAKADAEWRANSDYTKRPDLAMKKRPRSLFPCALERLSVFKAFGHTVLAIEAGKPGDADATFVLELKPEDARIVAAALWNTSRRTDADDI